MVDLTFSRVGKSVDCRDNAPSTWPVQRIAAETILGAQLSEVLNAEVTSNEKGGFSRRRVMKGVAWTVPVIVAAVGAPPAAASPGPVAASATLAAPSAVTVIGVTSLSGPTSFDVQTGSSFAGTSVSYAITIDAEASNQKALISVASVNPSSTAGKTVASGQGNTLMTTYSDNLTASPGNQKLHVAWDRFTVSGTPSKGTFSYVVTLSVTLSPSNSVTSSAILTVTFP